MSRISQVGIHGGSPTRSISPTFSPRSPHTPPIQPLVDEIDSSPLSWIESSPILSIYAPTTASGPAIPTRQPPLPPLFLGLPLTRSQIQQLPRKHDSRLGPRPHSPSLPPLSSDGPDRSSPIRGTAQERLATIRKKGQVKRAVTMTQNKEDEEKEAETATTQVLNEILKTLLDHGLSLSHLLFHVFDPLHKQGDTRYAFFRDPQNVPRLLDFWVSMKNSATGRDAVHQWALSYMIGVLRREAESITKSGFLQSAKQKINAEYILSFDMGKLYTYFEMKASSAMALFTAFSTSSRNATEGKPARAAKRRNTLASAALQFLGEFSRKNNFSKRILGLYLYATGSQRQSIAVMSHLGISESYPSLTGKPRTIHRKFPKDVPPNSPRRRHPSPPVATPSTSVECCWEFDPDVLVAELRSLTKAGTLRMLSDSMRDMARGIAATGLWAGSYDNINMVFRAAEQIVGRTDSQENGTCATIWPLWKAKLEDMQVSDLTKSFDNAPPLALTDILLSLSETLVLDKCLHHCILRIIVAHGGEKFQKFEDFLEKSLPATMSKIELHKTPLHPLPAWEIDESTILGQADVVEAIFEELKLKDLSNWLDTVKFLGGDQLSIARLRSLANIRAGHEGGYSGFGWGVWMPGLFHGKIADMHGFLFTHWGKPNVGTRNPGCLAFHNTCLHRNPILLTSLPPFRVCRDLVFVSLYARVLHCLLLISGKDSLEEYVDSVDNWSTIEQHARDILDHFANAETVSEMRWKRKNYASSSASASATTSTTIPTIPESDMVFENAALFLRDALISREFTDAIKSGDSGRVVLILKVLALSYRGNGRTKYAYEMLHFLHNISHVWPKPIRDIVLNNWLINPTGKPNSWVEIDLMQEHMNFWIKRFYQAHGSAASWEWLEMIAPCVDILRQLTRLMNGILGSEQGNLHAPINLTYDIPILMKSLKDHNIYQVKGRVIDPDDGSATADVISVGLQNLTDSSRSPLREYNQAFRDLQMRRRMKPLVPIMPESDTLMSNPSTLSTGPGTTFPTSSASDLDATSEPFLDEDTEDFDEELTEFEQAMVEHEELDQTLTRESARDVALDMDADMTGDPVSDDESEGEEGDASGFESDADDDSGLE